MNIDDIVSRHAGFEKFGGDKAFGLSRSNDTQPVTFALFHFHGIAFFKLDKNLSGLVSTSADVDIIFENLTSTRVNDRGCRRRFNNRH